MRGGNIIIRKPALFLISIFTCAALSACVPMMAASAVSMAAKEARGRPVSNEGLQPQAREQCSAQAAQYGTVTIIDVEQHGINRIIVWGTVGDGSAKRSFECDFGTKIVGFKLRAINNPS